VTHDERVAVFSAAQVYALERVNFSHRAVYPGQEWTAQLWHARQQLTRALGLPDDWGDSDEAMGALAVAQVHVEEAVRE